MNAKANKSPKTPTERVVISMLLENTGAHFMDSGSAYGRNHERNQGRDFRSEKPAVLVVDDSGISVTLNLFHFLCSALEYNSKLTAKFSRFAKREDQQGRSLPQVTEEFVAKIEGAAGIYGEGEPFTVNTYNGEDLLSQVIQYYYWTDDQGPHVFLQVHGGCDVRGGYTAPRAFDVNDDTAILDNCKAEIYCTARQIHRAAQQGLDLDGTGPRVEELCGANWSTDDGYHWYRDGACGHGAGIQLEKYPRTEILEGEDPVKLVREQREAGLDPVLFHRDGVGFCPDCGAPLAPDYPGNY